MSASRPALKSGLHHELFLDHYWLREELAHFCRLEKLSAAGSKIELTERIAKYLETGERLKPVPKPPKIKMPDILNDNSIVVAGWRCNQNLREYFEARVGAGFHFDKYLRDAVSAGSGITLSQLFEDWQSHKAEGGQKEIDGQFEYNRFTRAYYAKHPSATREEVISAWKTYRDTPKSQRTELI